MIKNGDHKQSFKNALSGLSASFKSEKNLRVMFFIAVMVVIASLLFHLTILEFTIVVWAIFAVLAVEMINTSLEAITDLVKEEWHQKAKLAKDVASGMVLLAALGALVIGSLIFFPKIFNLVFSFSLLSG